MDLFLLIIKAYLSQEHLKREKEIVFVGKSENNGENKHVPGHGKLAISFQEYALGTSVLYPISYPGSCLYSITREICTIMEWA